MTRLGLPSGKATKKLYDVNLRKQSVTVGDGTSDAATTSYTYDNIGNLSTMTEPIGQPLQMYAGAHWTCRYDARDRLLGVLDLA